jgi:hypothetical protein
MGASTKTVGGGGASGVADDFNNYLRQGLNNGVYGAAGQTGGMSGAINDLLNGGASKGLDLNGYKSFMNQFGDTANKFSGNPIQTQPINPIDYSGTGFNPGMFTQGFGSSAPQSQGYDFGSILNKINQGAPGGSFDPGKFDFSSILNQTGSTAGLQSAGDFSQPLFQAANRLQGNTIQTPGINLQGFDPNDPTMQAYSQVLDKQNTNNIADLRSRFGATGGASRGTPAAVAEAQYRQNLPAQNLTTLNSIYNQNVGNQLNAAGLNQQGILGAGSINNQNFSNVLSGLGQAGSLGIQGRGQDLTNFLQSRGLDITGAGTAAQNSIAAGANQLQGRGQDINSILQSLGLGLQGNQAAAQNQTDTQGQNLQNFLQSRGLDLSQLGLGQGLLGMNQSGNQFNSNQGFNAQNNNLQALMQMLSSGGNLALGGSNLALGGAGLQQQGQMGMLQQLMDSFRQANQLGTPQAQTVSKPSTFQNILSGINGITGAVKGIQGLFNPFGGGGGGGGYNSGQLMGGNTPDVPGAGINTGGLQALFSRAGGNGPANPAAAATEMNTQQSPMDFNAIMQAFSSMRGGSVIPGLPQSPITAQYMPNGRLAI